jgi:hypothetical protein
LTPLLSGRQIYQSTGILCSEFAQIKEAETSNPRMRRPNPAPLPEPLHNPKFVTYD